jgi:hypothetical protein
MSYITEKSQGPIADHVRELEANVTQAQGQVSKVLADEREAIDEIHRLQAEYEAGLAGDADAAELATIRLQTVQIEQDAKQGVYIDLRNREQAKVELAQQALDQYVRENWEALSYQFDPEAIAVAEKARKLLERHAKELAPIAREWAEIQSAQSAILASLTFDGADGSTFRFNRDNALPADGDYGTPPKLSELSRKNYRHWQEKQNAPEPQTNISKLQGVAA